MTSVASVSSGSGVELPPTRDQGNGSAGGGRAEGSAGAVGAVGSFAEVAPPVSLAGGGGSDERTVGGNVDEPRVLKVENGDSAIGGASCQENLQGSSVLGMQVNSGNVKQVHENNSNIVADRRSILADYNSFLSAFDEFAARAKGVAVGHGYYIGDMVWGKVKSHPWWPGQIFNEALASPLVRRSKHDGQVLVAFFGDNSYGWIDPAELIPFEDNFAEKSSQTPAKTFLNAVEEAVDELSRRRGLGLVCRCRNDFKVWPSNVSGYFVVDVGDSERGFYDWNQINDARDSFQPREMFSFVQQLALKPMNGRFGAIDFIKNKATVLACRKALFEEFDETYAQAFGPVPVRPACPSSPVVVDPTKAPLNGRLVIAEALGQGRVTVKPTKTKDQIEKDKYLFKRREEIFQMKSKTTRLGQACPSPHQLSVDGLGSSDKLTHSSVRDHMHQARHDFSDQQHQPTNHIVSVTSDIKHSEDLRRHIDGEKKRIKVKWPAEELNAENATLVEKKKRKKERNAEMVGAISQLPPAVSNRGIKAGNASGIPVQIPLINSKEGNQKDAAVGPLSSQLQTETDFGKLELQMMVTDLRALALNPFHGMVRSCPAVIRQVFLKFRTLVFQKSLVLPPPAEPQASEGNSLKSPAATFSVGPAVKTTDRTMKPLVRLDEQTKSGKKRGPSDRQEFVHKKKKLEVLEEIKKKKRLDDPRDIKKKKADDSKLLSAEKKIIPRLVVSQQGDTKESAPKIAPAPPPKAVKLELRSRVDNAAKNAPAVLPKSTKLEPSSRVEHTARVPSRTMLVMKFPAGAALPSGAELRARFARFGPLDHSGTRVFWKTYTCRLVFLYEVDAKAASKFAHANSTLFGNTNVWCYTRAWEAETVDPELNKIQKEVVSSTPPRDAAAAEQRMFPRSAAQPLQSPHSAQFKSCLKKPSGDEVENGNGRGTQVKFVFGRDESIKGGELLINEKKNRAASFPPGMPSAHSMESSDTIVLKFAPQTSSTLPPSARVQMLSVNMLPASRQINVPAIKPHGAPLPDISQQMLNLLLQCNNVVNNMAHGLGHLPFHPL